MKVVEYKCPNCSAGIKFDAKSQKFNCEFCGSSFFVQDIKKYYADQEKHVKEEIGKESQEDDAGLDQKRTEADDKFQDATSVYHCNSCGAEIIASEEDTATFCYYCHNPVILSGKLKGSYCPQKIIPFKIERSDAEKIFKKWCFKTFVPKDFKTSQQLEKITGLYVPFWLADCDITASYSAIGKKTRSWRSGDYIYTEIKKYSIKRKGYIYTNGIPADGSKKIDDELMESIEPFDYSELVDFSMSYLSGFYANKYDMGKEDMFPSIQARAHQAGRNTVLASIQEKYNSIDSVREWYNITKTKWHYILLPVWFMSYKYKDKVYEFVLNGQTGEIAGTPPLDERKLKLVSGLVFAATAAVSFLVFFFLHGGF